MAGNNVMTLTVNGSECSPATTDSAGYVNKPCVSVTLCDASGNNCQAINDILLDTGDYGFRIFQDVLSSLNPSLLAALNLSAINGSDGNPIYECIEYGDGATVWGPVVSADVKLGNEQASQVPIHLVGSSANSPSTYCAGAPLLSSHSAANYNGALGLGFRVQDCGSVCESGPTREYYTCTGGTCTESAVPLAKQVQNLVANLPTDNNGVIVELPSVPSIGALSAAGYVILGIGTEANNIPSGVTPYGGNANATFATTFADVPYEGFLDTGSNGIFVSYSGQPSASGGWYIPSCTLSLSATNTGAANAPNVGVVDFDIANADTLAGSGNYVFFNLGGPMPLGGFFDWGLPFFLGRNVYIGIDGETSEFNSVPVTGPFWAY